MGKKKQVVNAMELIEELYFNEDTVGSRNDDKRILAAMIAYNISRYSLNVIKNYNQILALSFVGTHDLNSECADYWNKAMDECGGKQMCLIQNMDITIELITKTFNDSTYSRKQTAIIAIKELCTACKDDLDAELLKKLTRQVLNALPGRIWEGKTKLFDALQDIVKHCHVIIHKHNEIKDEIIKSLLTDIARKSKLEYRVAAINAFGEIIKSLNEHASSKEEEIVILDEAMPIIKSIFDDYNQKEAAFLKKTSSIHKEQLEMKAKHKKDKEMLCCALRCIGNIWHGSDEIQAKYLSFAIEESFVYYIKRTDWMVSISIFKAIQSFVDGLSVRLFVGNKYDKLLKVFVLGILEGFADLKYTAVRHQAVVAMYKLTKQIKEFEQDNAIKEPLIGKEMRQMIKEKIDFIVNNDDKPIVVQQAIKLRKDIILTK